MRAAPALLALASCAGAAWACGTCAEDKMAATYDHAALQRAGAAGRVTVFCEVKGRYDAARLQSAAQRLRGVDPASLRLSREPAALSFALDARQQSPQAAVLALQAALPEGTRVGIVRVVAPQ